jgi:hypothetical protein
MVAKVLLLQFLGLLQHFFCVAFDRKSCSVRRRAWRWWLEACVAAEAHGGLATAALPNRWRAWWQWRRWWSGSVRGGSGAGGPTTVGHCGRPVGPYVVFCFFILFDKFLPRTLFASQHMCAKRVWRGSRHRTLCRPVDLSALCWDFPLSGGYAESMSLSTKAANSVVITLPPFETNGVWGRADCWLHQPGPTREPSCYMTVQMSVMSQPHPTAGIIVTDNIAVTTRTCYAIVSVYRYWNKQTHNSRNHRRWHKDR